MNEKKLLKIIAEFTSYEPDELKMNMNFADDLGIDSLDLAQILMSIEDTFDVEIDEDISDDIQTIGDAVEMLRQHLED